MDAVSTGKMQRFYFIMP